MSDYEVLVHGKDRLSIGLCRILVPIMAVITFIEIRKPGTSERLGILRIRTTRGDRLFLTLLGTSFIFLAWLGIVGFPLWAPLGISLIWGVICFTKV